jgi:hypothetical protein
MEFLKNWTANQLSGFNPAEEGKNLLGIIPTAYDKAREGNVGQQVTNFGLLKDRHPNLEVAPIFAGVPLGRRYLNKNREWQDSLVVDITLKPAKVGGVGYVPSADVYDDGYAGVGYSDVGVDGAARLQVR